jgi:hypothetical protein
VGPLPLACQYAELGGLKARYDPANLFRMNYNIPGPVASARVDTGKVTPEDEPMSAAPEIVTRQRSSRDNHDSREAGRWTSAR